MIHGSCHLVDCLQSWYPQVIFACVYGKQKTLRLQQAGMEFAVWTFKHASPERLAPVAPSVLAGLLTLLDEGIETIPFPPRLPRLCHHFTTLTLPPSTPELDRLFRTFMSFLWSIDLRLHLGFSNHIGLRSLESEHDCRLCWRCSRYEHIRGNKPVCL